MLELSLPACPICFAEDSLSRRTAKKDEQTFVWYECQECGSVLLWMGGDRWAFQKVGQDEKAHLLKQPMTIAELRKLTLPAEEFAASHSTTEVRPDVRHAEPIKVSTGKQPARGGPTRLLLVGVVLTLVCFIGAVIVMVIKLSPRDMTLATLPTGAQSSDTTMPVGTPSPMRQEANTVEELVSAIEDAPDGATIVLGPATYTLVKPLDIHKSLSLVGAGMDQTEIVCEVEGYVLLFDGSGVFRAEGITFRHQGVAEADVVVVEGGEVAFSHCRFTGAVSVDENAKKAGLLLKGNTKGLVQGCLAVENGTRGIRAQDQAQPTLEGNTCTDNESLGIGYRDSARGIARKNDCSRNGHHGIQIVGQAQPLLEQNTCNDNSDTGIAFLETTGGAARQNKCSRNSIGIGVGHEAQPTLEGNVCKENDLGGIVYKDSAGGVARQNECTTNEAGISVYGQAQPVLEENVSNDNRLWGIGVIDQAHPTLEGNVCKENDLGGIVYQDSTGGVARQNKCASNEAGISVLGQAQPVLEQNVCNDNHLWGISYGGVASGTARQNDCSGNDVGIWMADEAQPTLEGNTCNDNVSGGIVYALNSGGVARRNECSRNEAGITLGQQARATLEENICNDNVLAGILYGDSTSGEARGNVCLRNGIGIDVGGQAHPVLEGNICNDNVVAGIAYRENGGGLARRNELLMNGIGILIGEGAQPTLEENVCAQEAIPGEKCLEPDLDALAAKLERDFEECVNSDSGVRYVISGSGVNRVSLTWENDNGGTSQMESSLPICKRFTGFEQGSFVYVSAQISEGQGSIQCRIYDGSRLIAEGEAHGFASIATCSGRLDSGGF